MQDLKPWNLYWNKKFDFIGINFWIEDFCQPKLIYLFLIKALCINLILQNVKTNPQAVHGCRQFVFWYVWLSPLTNVTLDSIILLHLKKKKNKRIDLLLIKNQMKVRIMSSRYVLYMLGYPYDTKVFTKSCLNLYFG